MGEKMKAIKLTEPCSVDELVPTEVEIPNVKDGYDLIRIKAFGVNESEVTSRKGESDPDFQFPRILGIEGAGVIVKTSTKSKLKIGQKVVTMMGGMGRSIDGSYAEYALIKEENLIPFESDLDWSIIGALPEMLQTAYGSLTQSLHLNKDDILLIHGGTSTVGSMASILAHRLGAKVIATTRNPKKIGFLKSLGVDYPILDDKDFANHVKEITPKVDKVLELVGVDTLFNDMKFLNKGGYCCFTGALMVNG